ncbi:uncharacterized protein [Chanodichthys erythropterus]|uniref:uncharacterized protein n=1 Tax=Chanodichthys erythropterus TaxID=933992 RepID=UPI00351F09D8
MLFKVQYQGKKKYIKLNGASYPAFLREAKAKFSIPPETNMYVLDDSGTEVDEEVFSDILEEKADILWTIVNVLSVSGKWLHNYSVHCREHFFDIDSNEGYIAWKIKNTQRELSNGGTNGGRRRSSHTTGSSGPNLQRDVTKVQQLEGDQCREAISLLKHSTDNEQIFMKMRETFQHRQKLIHDPEQCSTVLTVFPRFLDTKGLVAQDFDLLFGAETSSKLLEKWDFLKAKVIEQAKDISKTPLLEHLIQSAEENTDEDDEVPGWDSDMASLLLLVYLLPPPPSGKKGAVKISTREAVDRVVKFHKSCRSLQEHSGPNQRRQPYILAVGTTRKHIHEFYIALDGDLLPCKGKSSCQPLMNCSKHIMFSASPMTRP